jgi:hypothetical protein
VVGHSIAVAFHTVAAPLSSLVTSDARTPQFGGLRTTARPSNAAVVLVRQLSLRDFKPSWLRTHNS